MIDERVRSLDDAARRRGAGAALVTASATARWLGATITRDVAIVISAGAVVIVSETGSVIDALHEVGLSKNALVAVDAPNPAPLGPFVPVPATTDFEQLRLVKNEQELALIASSAAVASAGQQALRAGLRAGASELELWQSAAHAIADLGAAPWHAVVDLMVGGRTALVGKPPGLALARTGDAVLFDLAPVLEGYWGDSCGTYCVGDPSATLAARHSAIAFSLEAAIQAMKPGVPACKVDARVRALLAAHGLECPHHIGHGVGTAPHEPPWLTPKDRTVLAEGMVIAVEPGAYSGGFGVRLEHLVAIEADGAQPLTTHSIDLK